MKKQISITIDVEFWYSSSWFNPNYIFSKYYNNEYPKTDLKESIKRILKFFSLNEIRATFFLLGEAIEKEPSIIKLIEENNHEIASHGYWHHDFLNKNEFLLNLTKSKNLIEKFSNKKIQGFRMPEVRINNWKLSLIEKAGYTYDSSIVPCIKIPGWYGLPTSKSKPFYYQNSNLREYPLSVIPKIKLPANGGWFLRNLNYFYFIFALNQLFKVQDSAILYLHPWEFSNNNPKFPEIPNHVFKNCGDPLFRILQNLISKFRDRAEFVPINEIMIK